MEKIQDQCYIRITPTGDGKALISTFIKNSQELREELQCLVYDIWYSLNVCHERIFLAYNRGSDVIEVHSVFGKDKKFKYDVVIHGFDSTYDLIDYLCELAQGTFSRHVMN